LAIGIVEVQHSEGNITDKMAYNFDIGPLLLQESRVKTEIRVPGFAMHFFL
jgi:hypothetical protein